MGAHNSAFGRRKRIQKAHDAANFQIEAMERRLLLAMAIAAFHPQQAFPTGTNPLAVTVADVNRDGKLDITTANQPSSKASTLLGDVPPTVLSINRSSPPGPITSGTSVTYAVTFSETVTGVDPSDFQLSLTGDVVATTPVLVSGSGASYQVTVNGISGVGTLRLNLVDDGNIRNGAGNPLQPSQTQIFQPAQTYAVQPLPMAAALADLNGDGVPDIVTTYRGGGGSVLLNNGNGTFQPEMTFYAGSSPYSIAVGDLNGDGKNDLVVGNFGTDTVSVLLGNGNGTFQAPRTFLAGFDPRSVAVADVNGDGKPDLLVANEYGYNVSALLGNGDGNFQPERTFFAGKFPFSVAVADVNHDGKPDLVVADNSYQNSAVMVLLGNGDGTFQSAQSLSVGIQPISVVAADLNNDGNLDVVAANIFSRTVSVLLGNGNGTFRPQETYAVGLAPVSVVVADVNGDGKPDLVVANEDSNSISILLGNGDGTFGTQQTFAASGPFAVVAADLNRDGRPDLAVIDQNYLSGAVSVFLNHSNGDFAGQTFKIVPLLDTFTGTSSEDQMTLWQDPDGTHIDIDWILGSATASTTAQMLINDPNGLTINGNGGNDPITLDYTYGNPLPNIMHVNSGTGTRVSPANIIIRGLQGTNPLAGTTLEIGRSTVFISYSSDPIAAIQGYVQNGYNRGAWNGMPTATTGVITSAAAQANPNHTTGIGYADSADGQGVNTTPNTIELTYTLYGDAKLDHQVNSADLQRLLASFNTSGAWDQADFNYDGVVNSADLQALLFAFNTQLGSQATPMAIAATPTASTTSSPPGSSRDPSHLMPVIGGTGSTTPPVNHRHPAKTAARKRH